MDLREDNSAREFSPARWWRTMAHFEIKQEEPEKAEKYKSSDFPFGSVSSYKYPRKCELPFYPFPFTNLPES
jgi:hypothetical protein